MRHVSRCLSWLILISATLLLCTTYAHAVTGHDASATPSSEGTPSVPLDTIPFELHGNLIYVRVRVNGSDPLRFILDSGAGICVINGDRASQMNIKSVDLGERSSLGGGEGKAKIAVAKKISFDLGVVQCSVERVLTLQMSDMESLTGGPIFGLLGYEILTRFVVEVDYAAKVVKLYDPKVYSYGGGGESLPLKIRDNVPLVRARLVLPGLTQLEGEFLIDSGYDGTLTVNSPVVTKYKLVQRDQSVLSLNGGVGGEFRAVPGRVPALQLGAGQLRDFPVIFSRAAKGIYSESGRLASLGGSILRRFRVVFDYSHKRMIVEPLPNLAEPFEEDMSGAVVIASGTDFRTIKVYKTFENTPATEAGLREGDVITAVNEKRVAELDLERVRQMFKSRGQEYHLIVERGEQTLQIAIRTRKWF